MVYMLFGENGVGERGAHTFIGAYPSRDEANAAAIALPFVESGHMSAWAHLAEFDGQKMTVTHWLNIPETEWDEYGELMWVAYD